MAAKPRAAARKTAPAERAAEDDRPDSPETGESLHDLLASITPDNIHPETNFGPPQGREEW